MEDKIYDMCIDKYVDDAEDTLKENFKKVSYCDEGYDDGLDDGDYLMYRTYDVDKYYVKMYYPQSTGIISCVDVRAR